MNPESAYKCAVCLDIFEDFEDAANCCGYGYHDMFICGRCSEIYFTKYEAEACCRECDE